MDSDTCYSLDQIILVDKLGINDPRKLSKEITSQPQGPRREYEIILQEASNLEYILSFNLEYILSLIRQAYDQN